MKKIEVNIAAPDFSQSDLNGDRIRLQDYRDKQQVLLVLNRGFT